MKRISILNVLFILLIMGIYPEDKGHLSGSLVLLGSDSAPPVILDSDRGWTGIATIDWDSLQLPVLYSNSSRKWRLHTSYEHSRAGGQTTIQIRIRNPESAPVFTHPWSEGTDVQADVYSNWYEDENASLIQEGRSLVEARFISPPRTPVSGKLYSLTLEAWDTPPTTEKSAESAGPAVQLAYARPLPTGRPAEHSRDAVNPDLTPEAAMRFALDFVNACITGDLPAYYRSQADPVRSLDDGKAMPRYRMNPPERIPGVAAIEDYKRRYDYKIYPETVYRELFPEWFDPSRPWIPGENSYLFLGHQDRLSGTNPEGVDYLVFLIEADSEGNWKVVGRPKD